jgi:cysteinyl-tRNA synthetase
MEYTNFKIYNTLTRSIEEFQPISKNSVGIYTCGPTVYDYLHIGNWYTYLRTDILIRFLLFKNYNVKWIINITDVGHLSDDADNGEDKIQKKANTTRQTAWQIAEFYTQNFLQLWKLLNISPPRKFVKATDHIEDQIKLIKKIEDHGYSYQTSDGIYFNTALMKNYSDFAQLDLDEQQTTQRINNNPEKINPSDFALWKFSPKNIRRDMEWTSPWGLGFPGWHIECSAMSMKYLGQIFDIHTGGIDHIPVHHTNEIAQSMAVTNKIPANYWFHSNHVTINGLKISKSLQNGLRIEEILDQGFSYEDIRLHVLESHYRSQSKFSLDNLKSSHNRLIKWYEKACLIHQLEDNLPTDHKLSFSIDQIISYLSQDLNTPMVLKVIDEIFDQINEQTIDNLELNNFKDFLTALDDLLGFQLSKVKDISLSNKQLVKKRSSSKQNNDFKEADVIRQNLQSQGIGLKDYQNKTYWYYL